jgi:hypothetical protein
MTRPASILFVTVLLGVAACTEVGADLFDPLDGVPPRVEGTFPGDGWRQVPVGIQVRVWFSEAIDPATVDLDNLLLFSGEVVVEGRYQVTVEPDGRGLVELIPADWLIPGVRYTLYVGNGITDRVGNALDPEVVVQFTTAW